MTLNETLVDCCKTTKPVALKAYEKKFFQHCSLICNELSFTVVNYVIKSSNQQAGSCWQATSPIV